MEKGDGIVKMPAVNAIPMRAGLKYRLAPAIYAKLESGVAKFTNGDQSAIIFSPGIGVRFVGFEVQAKYEIWKKDKAYGFWGLKAGYNF